MRLSVGLRLKIGKCDDRLSALVLYGADQHTWELCYNWLYGIISGGEEWNMREK